MANSFANWSFKHRLPLQSAPDISYHSGTSSFGMSGVNAHAILSDTSDKVSMTLGNKKLTWNSNLQSTDLVLHMLHPLLKTASKKRDIAVLQSNLMHSKLSFLWDHCVNGTAIFPGAGFLESSHAASKELLAISSAPIAIVESSIVAPLSLSSSKESSLMLSFEIHLSSGSIEAKSVQSSFASVSIHLKSSVAFLDATKQLGQEEGCSDLSLEIMRASCPIPRSVARVYEGLAAAGLQYGPSFRLMKNIHCGYERAFSCIDVPREFQYDTSGFLMHPSSLDTCLQMGALVEVADNSKTEEAYVPASIAAFFLAEPVWSGVGMLGYSCPSNAKYRKSPNATYRDHIAKTGYGNCLAHVEALEAKPLPSEHHKKINVNEEKEEAMYQIEVKVTAPETMQTANKLKGTSLFEISNRQKVSSMLLALQASMGENTLDVELSSRIESWHTSNSVHSWQQNSLSSGMWGMLRSLAAEAPSVSYGGYKISGLNPKTQPMDKLRFSNHEGSKQSDLYGVTIDGGVQSLTTLKRCTLREAPDAFHLLPEPRGAFNNLKPRSVSSGEQLSDNIELSVKAVGINFRDVLNVLGMYPGDPGAPGGDCSGIITQTSSELEDTYKVGTAVFGLAAGSLGTQVRASSKTMVPLPAGLSFEQAASMPTVFITVDTALRQAASMKPGETVLLHAAAGGVGLAGIQLAQSLGIRVVATAGSPFKRSLVRSLGIDSVLGSRDSTFAAEISLIGGVDVVLNSLTSTGMVAATLSCLRLGGRFIEISKRDIWSGKRSTQERPDVAYSLLAVDFMDEMTLNAALKRVAIGSSQGFLRPLPFISHSLANVVSALRQMSQARHIGKIIVRSPSLSSSCNGAQNHSIVITGGMGVLGIQMVEWLARQQAFNVFLLGRTGRPSSSSKLDINQEYNPLQAMKVNMILCDASFKGDLATILVSEMGAVPLLGVLHAGGVLSDGVISTQTNSKLNLVMGAKVDAAVNLQKNAYLQPLCFNVLFSSVAALLGSPGQINYSAANAILDSISTYSQSMGSSIVSIQWGAWAGAGMASNDRSTSSRVERTGMALLPPKQGLSIFEAALILVRPATLPSILSANRFVWSNLLKRFRNDVPFFFEEFKQEDIKSLTTLRPAKKKTQNTSTEDRQAAVQSQVSDAVTSILGSEISPTEPLMAAGLDSLGAVELKNALEGRLGLELPGTLIFDYPTINALSGFLKDKIIPEEIEIEEFNTSPLMVGIEQASTNPVAVLGISSRSGPEDTILQLAPQDAISRIPLKRWDLDDMMQKIAVPPQFGGFLSDIDLFDISMFGLSQSEAELMDAQQRILLQLSFEVSNPRDEIVLENV